MRRICLLSAALLALTNPATTSPAAEGPRLDLHDGDRIVLIGDDLIERDQKSGYLETLLTLLNPDKNLTFRNLGWSGDTVYGDARAGFGVRADGYRQLREHVLALKPTVIVVGYGMSESFDGEPGVRSFESGLNTLLDDLAPTRARVVLLTPITHEDLGRPLPDPTAHNLSLRLYGDAIARIARARGLLAIDLEGIAAPGPTAATMIPGDSVHLTDDGIHPTAFGYRVIGARIASALINAPLPRWRVRIGADGQSEALGTRLSGVKATARGLRFEAQDAYLPVPPVLPRASGPGEATRLLVINGLEPGRYTLKIDGKAIATGSPVVWAGYKLRQGPELAQVQRLRSAINEKNRLYFYRWRPQNETYLFGFRKHEQGNNAREIPLFDPLVADAEKTIARLRVPVAHVYELVPESDAAL